MQSRANCGNESTGVVAWGHHGWAFLRNMCGGGGDSGPLLHSASGILPPGGLQITAWTLGPSFMSAAGCFRATKGACQHTPKVLQI